MLKKEKTKETFCVFKVSYCIFAKNFIKMKENILYKATDMFLTYGFKSVTMDDIANKMGISKKTIYTHYKTKTELVKDSSLQLFEFISSGIDCICEEEKNPIEELYEIKKFVMLHLKDEKSSPQYQLQKYYPKIYQMLKTKQFEVMHSCVKENLKRGVEMGEYLKKINTEFVARIYFSGIISIKDDELFPIELFPKDKLLENYLEYHLRGICTEKGLKTLENFILK